MTKDEALKLALEAFEWNYNTDLDNIPACELWAKMLKANITAIKEALAQPEIVIDKSAAIRIATSLGWEPKRTWVGLTEEEIAEMHNEIKVRLMGTYRTEDIYRAIEAKLKEKNGG